MVHRANLAALLLMGTLWAGLLVISGSMIGLSASTVLPGARGPASLFGITIVAAGEYVFLVVVASRIFPKASSRLLAGTELFLASVMFVFLVAAAAVAIVAGANA